MRNDPFLVDLWSPELVSNMKNHGYHGYCAGAKPSRVGEREGEARVPAEGEAVDPRVSGAAAPGGGVSPAAGRPMVKHVTSIKAWHAAFLIYTRRRVQWSTAFNGMNLCMSLHM